MGLAIAPRPGRLEGPPREVDCECELVSVRELFWWAGYEPAVSM
jgi:hypothetical protein